MHVPHRVMPVYPAGTRTQFFAAAGTQTPIPWPTQQPEHVARAIVRGIECDRRSVYPSKLFRLVLLPDRLLPFTRRIKQRLELRNLDTYAYTNTHRRLVDNCRIGSIVPQCAIKC